MTEWETVGRNVRRRQRTNGEWTYQIHMLIGGHRHHTSIRTNDPNDPAIYRHLANLHQQRRHAQQTATNNPNTTTPQTIRDLTHWYFNNMRQSPRESSRKSTTEWLTNHVLDTPIEHRRYDDLLGVHWETHINQRTSRKSGQPLSAQSRRKLKSAVSSMYKRAIQHGLATLNPVTGIEIIGATPPPKALPTRQAFANIGTYITETINDGDHDELHAATAIGLLTCGLRSGEICARTWNNYQTPALTIDTTTTRTLDKTWTIGPTKTGDVRTIELPDLICQALDRLHALSVELFGERTHIFWNTARPEGDSFMTYHQLELRWRLRRDGLGAAGVTPHAFRNALVTLHHDAGIPSASSAQMLGHSIVMNEGVYARGVGERAVEAASLLQDQLMGEK